MSSARKLVPLLSRMTNPVFRQPSRSTWVFKRRHPTNISDPLSPYYYPLSRQNYIYEILDRENKEVSHDLKIILTTYIKGLGDVGDVVSVNAHIARNSLLLPKKAVYASPENLAYYEKLKETRQQRKTFSSPFVAQTVTDLTSSFFPVIMNNVNPWTIEPWHVKLALEHKGYEVNGPITLPEDPISGPDHTKNGKAFVAHIKINDNEVAPLICVVFQWGLDMAQDWEQTVAEAALPQHQEALEAALQHRLNTIQATLQEEEERRRNCLPF